MMRKSEIYGGAAWIKFNSPTETIAMPAGTDVRVWNVFSDEFTAVDLRLQLPDPVTIRPSPGINFPGVGATGGVVYFIYSNASAGSVTIEDSEGVALGFLAFDDLMVVALFNPFAPGGQWCIMKKDAGMGLVGFSTETISFGSDHGPSFDDVWSYAYETDAWTSEPTIPVISGTAQEATAADHIGVFTKTYITWEFVLVQWIPGGTYVQWQTPSFECVFSALIDSSGGLFGSSTLGDFFHVSNPAVGGTPRHTEYFSISGSAWTLGPPTPAAFVPLNQTLGLDQGFDHPAPQLIYLSATAPDSATAWIGLTLTGSVYIFLQVPPWPWGHTAPSAVGLPSGVHMQNGNFDVSGLGGNPGFATDSHHEYQVVTNTWAALSRSPVVARGMGARGTRLYRDRYTFGMGADATAPGVPFEQHFEYNVSTRTYRARAAASWGDNDRREGAWARTDR